jgi:hypothetical protein
MGQLLPRSGPRPFRPEPIRHTLQPHLTVVLVDHHQRGAAVAGHVHDLSAVRQLLADVEVAQRVRRALDASVIALQRCRLEQFGEAVGHWAHALALLADGGSQG